MKKSFVIISAVAAIVFDLIACLADSNAVIYNLFMGLCCAAFCVYVAGLFTVGFSRKEPERTEVSASVSERKAA
ncbi:MAG: hypothetical protein J6D57_01485 [Mogibacterium sp.]|nr:hypothetical protein [Mogibacterium sp.]